MTTTVSDNNGTGSTVRGDDPSASPGEPGRWQDASRPADERVADLLSRMTLAEKVAQLRGIWVGADTSGDGVAPHQQDLDEAPFDWAGIVRVGLGQLTRPFGTAPVDPTLGARALARTQSEIVAGGRFGIPALAHEECLTGFMTWGATVYPTPLAWAATFDPGLVERMAAAIGADLRRVGVHQGLAPVLDVTRDPRWGRTEETLGEDPYLVATLGTSYVRGLQSAGVVATLKHFAGYSSSRAGRNFGPVSAGPRELADIVLPPFELALRDGLAGSVMQSYTETDGMPAAADTALLTGLLRDTWGFTGTVVSDYFAVAFLELLHHVAGSPGESAGLALAAGVDVELPTGRCYGDPLLAAVSAGAVDESLVDRAAGRVLLQKCQLGLLDPDWDPIPPGLRAPGPAAQDDAASRSSAVDGLRPPGSGPGSIDLDPPQARALARQVAAESVVLLANNGALPLRADATIALVGPQADARHAMLGCYTFPNHVGSQHPDLPVGVEIDTLLGALRAELPAARIRYEPGCPVDRSDVDRSEAAGPDVDRSDAGGSDAGGPDVDRSDAGGPDTGGIAAAVAAAQDADVCVVALGDRSGLFGRGTSGEGCDAPDLALPGDQARLLSAVLGTGTPVVLVLLAGRPYALGAFADRLAAAVVAFFPGEEGGSAVAAVLAGHSCPTGRLPVSVPRLPGGQPTSYLAPQLGWAGNESSVDPTPLYPFGHGLSYTSFEWTDAQVDDIPISSPAVAGGIGAAGATDAAGEPVEIATDGAVRVSVLVGNNGDRAGAGVVQLYLHDPVAQTTRPVVRLIGYARVELDPGQARRVEFDVHADLSSFTGRDGRRVVEPGDLELRLSRSSVDAHAVARIRLVGAERTVDHRRRLVAGVTLR